MNNIVVGEKALITTVEWFFAPDGRQYRAVFGTIKGVYSDEDTLGIKTNRSSTNWYVEIGNMTIAGCQIHYVTRTDTCNLGPSYDDIVHEDKLIERERSSRIYDAGD